MNVAAGTIEVDDVDGTVERFRAIGDDHDCTVQAIDARYVAGEQHLRQALRLADRAIERETAIARSRSMELLLYVAGTRQIDRAFELGLSEGQCRVVVVVDAVDSDADVPPAVREDEATEAVRELLDTEPFEDLIGDTQRITDWFEIDEDERNATDADLEALVLERVALLVVTR